MEPIATFSGLASGVQWRDMIDQIMQVERRPARLLEQQITSTQTRSAAWLSFQNALTSFQDTAKELAEGDVFRSFSTSVSGSGFKASASDDAAPGSYSVEVLQLASAEKLGGDIVASRSDALGLSGEFWLNGSRISVEAGDSLDDLAYAINAANTGSDATRVSAAVVGAGDGYQLVLSSEKTGAAGIDLAGDNGLLGGLGLTDGTTSLKHATSDGGTSDGFGSATTAIGTLLGLSTTGNQTIHIGDATNGVDVTVDLGTDSLEDIAAAITTAADADPSNSIQAAVVQETVDGETAYRLDISGSTQLTDSGGVLTTLGVLEGNRDAVAQRVESSVALGGGTAVETTALTTLGAKDAETLSVTGTKADGSTFSMTLAVGTDVTDVRSLLDALNGPAGYDGSANVSLDAGRLIVTDATGGASQLDLAITANNETGGSLDFGSFDTTVTGRAREIVDGSDAAVRIDGVYSTHATNSVSGSIPGVSLTLTGETTEPGAITVSRDVDAVVKTVKSLVDGYNGIAGFVNDQFTGGEGSSKPLSGDSTLRGMRTRILNTMRETLTTGVGGDLSRLTDIGVEIQKDGTFSFEEATLRSALESDPKAVERLLGVHGATTGSGIRYLDSGDATRSGSYTVAVTQAATVASTAGTGGLGDALFQMDPLEGTTDALVLTDLGSGKEYRVGLTDGQSTADLPADIQNELGRATQHTIVASNALEVSGGGAATADTKWSEVFQGGADAGVAEGDSITLSGRRPDGTSFMRTVEITDPTTQTLGGLRDEIQNAVGSEATVTLDDTGAFRIVADDTGSSLLEVTLTAETASGGLTLGTEVETDGRPVADIEAAIVDGALRFTHTDYGSAAGFSVAYTHASTGTELGLEASGHEYRGTDVQGTIGGMAATGAGRILTGADGTDVDGLMLRVEDTFSAGSVTFSRGIASLVERTLEPMLGSEAGSIQSIIDGLDERVTSLNDRIDQVDARIERRREDLIRRFTAMEQAMAVAQNQSSWLMSQIGALPGSYSSNAQ